MKESLSETLWNEDIGRRCVVGDIVEKVKEARLGWYGHVTGEERELLTGTE